MLGQVWEGCLRVLAGYNMVPWRGQPRPPGRVRTYTTATLPPPNPARSAPDRCVHGPSPCGELPKGWESLIYPFNTHLWSVEVCTCPIPPHLTPLNPSGSWRLPQRLYSTLEGAEMGVGGSIDHQTPWVDGLPVCSAGTPH